jgi:hypothetical protein
LVRSKKIIPPFATGHDHAAAANLQNVGLMHVSGKAAALGRWTAWPQLLMNTVEFVMVHS